MTILLRCLVLFLVALSVEASAPAISCVPSRTTGTAPLFVHFDCTGTTDADTTKPFHDLLFTHTFGDLSAGAWTYGANTALSKNFATGPVAGHVYETAGTYVVTSTVSDGTTLARVTNTITVSDPDVIYAGTATVCFFNTVVGTGCPSGATQTVSNDFDAAISSCFGTTKRCLFKRGDTFAASTVSQLSAVGPNTIGAYGSGAKPIVTGPSGNAVFWFSSGTINDLRIMDLDCRGTGVQDVGGGEVCIKSASAASGVTILRVDVSAMGGNSFDLTFSSSGVTNSVIQDSTASGNLNGYELIVNAITSAFLGNSFGPVGATGEHTVRTGIFQKSVLSSNTISTSNVNKAPLTIRAGSHTTNADDTFYVVASDNKIIQGTATNMMFYIETAGGSSDERVYDVIVERNWVLSSAYTGASSCNGFKVTGVRLTIRNNLVDLSNPTTCATVGIQIDVIVGPPVTDDVNVYNNTFYSGASARTMYGVNIAASVTNTIAKNNLCWFDNGTQCINDAGTGSTVPLQPTAGGSSSVAQTTGSDPSFDGGAAPTGLPPINFRIGTGSYAAAVGVAIFPASNDDFFHCDDTTSNERLGALVPRVRATCRGSAGP